MGSIGEFPDANSPELRLVVPTEEEKRQTWIQNHAEWGGALGLQDYLEREPYVASIPLSENGGLRYWILTTATGAPGSRPVLSSCETLRKRVLVTDPKTGTLREGIAYGLGSVYTSPHYRGKRYASRMLQELIPKLEKGFETIDGKHVKPIASALWSDIGKSFYAKLGWAVCPSFHVSFRVPETSQQVSNGVPTPAPDQVEVITYENLESFCKRDEELLRKQLLNNAKGARPQFAFAPDYDILRWALFRDEFIASRLFKGQELAKVKGAVAGPEGKRVWAIWARSFYNAETVDKNTMYILRLVFEDESAPREELAASFAAIMHKAQAEARLARVGKIELWNPTPAMDVLIKESGLDHDVAERENDSIPSLMWFGDGDASQVEWVANEKYCWS
ncbi:hypothetical protein PFICI_05080 [Pestalotiopsis fici W106-1]|uniref:LYC1 C-terminal domain-containing protein n=1 Tax=Pestalotiopsis fici (strain W106-1 / CGMCC3.15140) TaxID=1229662 RepID=W3XAZ2_PESFW|nr:uncharacterized protein PFICI_05080 [Pestalotiopsis fici W106-1]ETS83204.1 hypothetical protein PFICI_05080 [Pestalotiopsis fici W106-1]